MTNQPSVPRYLPWLILAAAVVINLTMGFNYSWSVIKKALVTDWHWTNVEAALPFTVYSIVYATTMFFAGRAQDKFGPRRVATAGSLILAVGMLTCSYATTPAAMAIGYGILVAIGFSVCYATTIPTSVKWFPPAQKGAITGLVVGALGLAAVYMAPLANWLLAVRGIPAVFLILGLGAAGVILVTAQLLRTPPAAAAPAAAAGTPTPAADNLTWRQMVRTATFRKLWLMFLFLGSAGQMMFAHMATIAKTQADWEGGFYLVILLALFNTGGRMLGGALSDRFGRLAILKAVYFFFALDLALFPVFHTPALLSLGAAVVGLTYGACIALFPSLTCDYYGVKNLGANYGILFTSWGISGFLGPIYAGWAADVTGSYVLAYYLSAGLLFVALALAFTVRPPRHSPATRC